MLPACAFRVYALRQGMMNKNSEIQMEKLDKKNIEDILALTPVQEGMLFHYLKDPQSENYLEQLSLEISGEIQKELFEKAWEVVIKANEMLRTSFRWEKLNKPAQVVIKNHTINLTYHDLSTGENTAGKKRQVERIKQEDRKVKFNLREVPFRVILCKLSDKDYHIVISNHHILYDGWSNGILLREFFQAYHSLDEFKGEKDQWIKPQAKNSFKEFVQWIQGQDKDKQRHFWEEYLAGFTSRTELPIKIKKRDNETSTGVGNHPVILEKTIKDQLEFFAGKYRLTLATFFYSAWGILLRGYCGSEDVIFGTTVSGRSAPIKSIEDMVGLFINTIPLRVNAGVGKKTKDLLYHIDDNLSMREKYESTPLVDIKEYSPAESNEELFDSIVVVGNYPLDRDLMRENRKSSGRRLVVNSYSIVEATTYDLTVAVTIGDKIEINFIYNPLLFQESGILRLSGHFTNILNGISKYFEKDISGIELLPGKEKQQILIDFNKTAGQYPKDKTIHVLFEEQAERTPDSVAVVGAHELHERRKSQGHITYRELSAKSDRLAQVLRERGVLADSIVGIKMERSVEMIIGIFGILKADGAYLPIEPEYPEERIDYMLKDSSAKVLLASPAARVEAEVKVMEESIERIDISKELPSSTSTLTLTSSKVSPANLAYTIYTSGTTGKPKGVMVDHQGVVNYICWAIKQYVGGDSVNFPLYTPLSFDLTVTSIYTPLLSGNTIVVYKGNAGLTLIENIIEDHRIGVVKLTPSHLKLILEQKRSGLHLSGEKIKSGIKRFIVGGEAMETGLAARITEAFDEAPGIYNEYGPTEATVGCMIYRYSRGIDARPSVPIGKAGDNVHIYLLDKNTGPVPVGAAGEIYISGDGVARGYLNRPELTNDRILENPFVGGKRMYRTGDLARYLPEGDIEFLGRIDYQVKIRGFRIEPAEIENRLLTHPAVKEAVVMAREGEGEEKYLCAYTVLYPGKYLEKEALRDHLAPELPGYMVPPYFAVLEKMPLTPNGKVDRKALPEPEVKSGKNYVPPRNETENLLAEIWAEVLAIDKEQIGIHDNFFLLGGHSLKAVALIGRICKALSVEISINELFERPTIEGISHCIAGTEETPYLSVKTVEEKEYYPLSSPQRRLFLINQMDPSGITYNVTGVNKLEGGLEKKCVEECFRKLIDRHESLRTSFKLIDGEPVQKIHKENSKFQITDYNQIPDHKLKITKIIEDFVRPFDLSKAPLLRVGLVQLDIPTPPRERNPKEKHLLLLDMHHIISDGVSMEIFIKEFTALYVGDGPLPELRLQYKDFSHWQNQRLASPGIKKQEAYWLHQFEGEIPVLALPLDYPRPPVRQFVGNQVSFDLGEANTAELNRFVKGSGGTLFTVLLGLFGLLLSKLSGREDIVVGTPTAGRSHHDLENIIGMFVNTLVLRIDVPDRTTFTDFIKGVRENFLTAFENQDYPYENMVDRFGKSITRDMSHNPVFDAVFVMQNPGMQTVKLPGLKITPYEYNAQVARFDLTLMCIDIPGNLKFTIEYSSGLFKESTIQRYISYFKELLSGLLADYNRNLWEIEIIPREEKQQILFDFNHTHADYPRDKKIHELFVEQVEKRPNQVALVEPKSQIPNPKGVGGNISITYNELNGQSNQLADLLKQKGVGVDAIVGIMMERSIEMIIGILGILKAGGAYLPIDPGYPQERIDYMLKDSAARLLVTTDDISSSASSAVKSLLPATGHRQPATSLAYIIYTSGTTGRPKGSLIGHRNLVRLLVNDRFPFDFGPADIWTMFHSYCFDFSVWEMWGALVYGGRLIIVSPMTSRDPGEFPGLLKKEQVTILNQTPGAFYHLSDEALMDAPRLSSLRYVIFGGEALAPARLKEWKKRYPRTRLVNMYGITETTVHVTFKEITDREILLNESNIGKPIPTLSAYIMDKHLKLQPPGVAGELCVGGDGTARGYLNRPELTGEKFTANRYKPGERLYKSGDLAKFFVSASGEMEMEYLGRIDHQVKIRGFRIELGEIENRLCAHGQVKEALVSPRVDDRGDKYLCAYVVMKDSDRGGNVGDMDTRELKRYLSRSLPDYMVPSHFVQLDRIPLTSSGKVDRNALPEPEIKAVEDGLAPRDDLERKLAEIWSRVLGAAHVGIDDDFFQLGGHSLKAVLLVSELHKAFDLKVPLARLFQIPTIRGLSGYLKGAEKDRRGCIAIEPVEKKEYYVLSSAQKRLYVLQQMEKEYTGYNMPGVFVLKGEMDGNRIECIFRRLVHRHEGYRTSFEIRGGEPVQRIHDEVEFEVKYYRLSAAKNRLVKEQEELIARFIRSFNLAKVPLLRVGLAELEKERHLLLVDMHHIISDGTSIAIVKKELSELYGGKALPGLRLQYKDYSRWQSRQMETEAVKRQGTYWLSQFEGEIPALNLGTDFPRPPIHNFQGDRVFFEIDGQLTSKTKEAVSQTDSTLYMVLLAVLNILLFKYTEQEDIVVGVPIVGRPHVDMQNIIGMFVNMLPVRNHPRADKTVREFLQEVKANALDAFENQDYPFEELVENLDLQREPGRHPLVDVVIVLQNFELSSLRVPGLEIFPHEIKSQQSKFDLNLQAEEDESNGKINMALEFATALFRRSTAEKFTQRYVEVLKQVAADMDMKLRDIVITHDFLAAGSASLENMDIEYGF
jgi:amino acid adenylation domain-containing protein